MAEDDVRILKQRKLIETLVAAGQDRIEAENALQLLEQTRDLHLRQMDRLDAFDKIPA